MQQKTMQLAGLPIQLVFLRNGCVALVPFAPFKPIIEGAYSDKVWATFYPEFFTLTNDETGEDYDYRAAYLLDVYPMLKQWLKQQNLIYPTFREGE